MDATFSFPTSPFTKATTSVSKQHGLLPHFSTPAGMLLPKDKQPPPMYGPRGSTIPPKYLNNTDNKNMNHNQNRGKFNNAHNSNNNRGNYRGGGRGNGPRGNGRGRGGGRQHNNNNNYDQHQRNSNVQNYELQSKTDGTWCETCDRGFRSLEQLDEHKLQHKVCGIDGCTFTGHPAVVKKHVEMQHSNGLFEQIKKLDTPEEISKWREERRKRYPTKSNIELRQQVQEEKMKRGEKIMDPNNRFGNKRDRRQMKSENPRTDSHPAKKKQNKRQRTERPQPERKEPQKPVVQVLVAETNTPLMIEDTNLPMFMGTASMKDYWKTEKQPAATNALTSLLGLYGSDSESENEDEQQCTPVPDVQCTKPEELFSVLPEKPEVPPKIDVELEEGEISDSVPEPIETVVADNQIQRPETISENGPRKRQRNRKNKNTANEKVDKVAVVPVKKSLMSHSRPQRRTNTMLEKLLQTDIRHERNVLLQCVRYVVEQQMFGIGAENKESAAEASSSADEPKQPENEIIEKHESSPDIKILTTNFVDEE
jgi:nuclear fragile X mental retardation-interacting protein 1